MGSKLEGVSFPLGRSFLTDLTPGRRMASILALPNLGNEPTFELAFGSNGDGVQPLRAENARRILEAFWPDAAVKSVAAEELGQLKLTYEAPTRRSATARQSIDARTCSAQGGSTSDDEFVSAEVVQQENIEQVSPPAAGLPQMEAHGPTPVRSTGGQDSIHGAPVIPPRRAHRLRG